MKGTRLPEDWQLPEEWKNWARALGLEETTIRWEADKFHDYWIGLSGAKATKMNWFSTWRNWCRRVCERQPKQQSKQTWQMSDDELLHEAGRRGITTRGMSRQQLISALDARQ